MKNSRIALAAALASLTAGAALAQSGNSVELYGVADAYVGSNRYTNTPVSTLLHSNLLPPKTAKRWSIQVV